MGILLLCAAVVLVGYNLASGFMAKAASDNALTQLEAHMGTAPTEHVDPGMEMPALDIEGRDYVGILEIPALGMRLPVIGTWSYDRLTKAPCRYAGTPYRPGFVIAAHNYVQHFGYIDDVSYDDQVIFTDVEGRMFTYAVREVVSLDSDAVEEMTDLSWDLSLFTCNLAGNRRVTVRCQLMSSTATGMGLSSGDFAG